MTDPTHKVLIAGGGIGGLTTALALAAKGIPNQVLEQAAAFQEVGAGLQLGPNAFRVFVPCIDEAAQCSHQ